PTDKAFGVTNDTRSEALFRFHQRKQGHDLRYGNATTWVDQYLVRSANRFTTVCNRQRYNSSPQDHYPVRRTVREAMAFVSGGRRRHIMARRKRKTNGKH